ncbi:MAG: 3-methyl-2-oxobutanoate hydroxymethyltransferase [Deltaproteobacteria bacterium]|nr:3-methyl-2-oxobutanoate hydroxymethyltransferase [Deltaproteobacteria bacterium]
MARKKIGIDALRRKKERGEKITMLTAYDFPSAQLLDELEIDTILVGDSLGNVVLGYKDTVPVTMDEMIHHTRAVRRGVETAMLIGDMPFGSFQLGPETAIANGVRFMKEAGADAVKLEGGGPMIEIVDRLTKAGVPVVGHLGLTPQTAGMLGGYRVQGETADKAKTLLDDALALQQAGAFMLVLECVPEVVATRVTQALAIPTIGIGAGPGCDGQVLVFHDLLGIRSGFTPKFVKKYAQLETVMREAISAYRDEVKSGAFPAPEHCFPMASKELDKLY